jgi:hypothetical protein
VDEQTDAFVARTRDAKPIGFSSHSAAHFGDRHLPVVDPFDGAKECSRQARRASCHRRSFGKKP